MSKVNMASVVTADFCSQELTLKRTTGSYNQYGEWVDGIPVLSPVSGSWQKVSAEELVQIGLGDIKEEVRKLLTPADIRISEDDDKGSDRIIDGIKRYKVIRVGDNSAYGYNRAFALFEGTE